MAMEEHGKDMTQYKSQSEIVSPNVETDQPMDAANKALVDALHVTFKLLKLLMVAAIVWYVAYGAFQVKPEEVALIKRFGKIVGIGPDRELKQGLHWAWPFPIDEIIKVRKDKRTANVDLWFSMTEQERIQGRSMMTGESLVPGRDEYVITGDANILHISMIIKYRVLDAFDYISNIKDADNPEVVNPETYLIKTLADNAIIQAAAQFKVDDLLGSQKATFTSQVKTIMDESLASAKCGLQLEDVLINKIDPPRQVVANFNEVRNAAEQMHGMIQTAMGDSEQKLTQTAGQGYSELIVMLEREKELAARNDPALPEVKKQVRQLLEQAGGSIREILERSQSYRTKMVKSAQADAEYFQALLPEYRKNPKVVLTRLLLSTLEQTLPSVHKWYLPKDVYRIRMQIDRDPDEMKYAQPQNEENPMGAAQPSMPMGSPPGPMGPPPGQH
ncbi:MAG: protease modulator HflK [Phycisphaerae bacterium]|jgi:membrane protease subunit HflK|nr:protease modulator HflK [Phycisphaerae bacterium]